MGDERYAEYQRALDLGYQNLLRIAYRYGLDADVANQVFSLKQDVAAQSSELLASDQLTAEYKKAALGAIQTQTETTLAGLLGQQALDVYRDRGGAWIEQIGR